MRRSPLGGPDFTDFGLVSDLFRSMADMLGARPARPRPEAPSQDWAPAVDVYETGQEVVVKAELPGLKREDISVEATEEAVTLSGERAEEGEATAEQFVRRERPWGRFERTVVLPAPVQSEQAKAKFTDGVLEVRLPKVAQAERRQIQVE